VGLNETHMVKFMDGLKAHEILLQDRPTTRGNPHLLTMVGFCYNVKKRKVIQNEITQKRCGKMSNHSISTLRCCLHYWRGP